MKQDPAQKRSNLVHASVSPILTPSFLCPPNMTVWPHCYRACLPSLSQRILTLVNASVNADIPTSNATCFFLYFPIYRASNLGNQRCLLGFHSRVGSHYAWIFVPQVRVSSTDSQVYTHLVKFRMCLIMPHIRDLCGCVGVWNGLELSERSFRNYVALASSIGFNNLTLSVFDSRWNAACWTY